MLESIGRICHILGASEIQETIPYDATLAATNFEMHPQEWLNDVLGIHQTI